MIRLVAYWFGSYDDFTADINAMIHLIVRRPEQHAEPYYGLALLHRR